MCKQVKEIKQKKKDYIYTTELKSISTRKTAKKKKVEKREVP